MGARVTRAAPWALLAVSLAGCGIFGPAGLNAAVPDMLSVWTLLVAACWLAVRGARTLAARRRWRRLGGPVIGQQDGPTAAELARELASTRELAERNHARLETVLSVIGSDARAAARRSEMHAVPDSSKGA